MPYRRSTGGKRLLGGAVLAYLLCVIGFALLCPFNRTSVAADWWVYGMSALVTAGGSIQARKPRAV